MTQPEDSAPLAEGTDIDLDPAEVDAADPADKPATTDPEQLVDDGELGGVGGQGGAG